MASDPVPSNDDLWVAGLRAGEPWAFDAVYAAYRARVFGFLVRLSGRRDLAEDLLQETFLRLANHGPRLQPQTRLRSWLFTVARNLWISHRRWAWVDGERLAELGRWALGAGGPPTPLDGAVGSQRGAHVEAALQALPEGAREVALLVMVEGLEPQEAAAILGIKPEAVRQRLARAREALRAVFEDGGGE